MKTTRAMRGRSKAYTLRRLQKLVIGVAVLLLLFGATAEFLPHHHESEASERVCQLCHPTVIGVQQTALKLPTPSYISWTIDTLAYVSANTAPVRRSSSRAPPVA